MWKVAQLSLKSVKSAVQQYVSHGNVHIIYVELN